MTIHGDEWIGLNITRTVTRQVGRHTIAESVPTDDNWAINYAADRFGVQPSQIELRRTNGAVLVRVRTNDNSHAIEQYCLHAAKLPVQQQSEHLWKCLDDVFCNGDGASPEALQERFFGKGIIIALTENRPLQRVGISDNSFGVHIWGNDRVEFCAFLVAEEIALALCATDDIGWVEDVTFTSWEDLCSLEI